MIEDPTKAEINLFNALVVLDKAFTNDGTCIEAGLQTHLRTHEVGSYTPQVAKILIEQKIVQYNPKGTHKNPMIYYNKASPPSLDLCREIFELIRSRKRITEAIKNQPKEKPIEEKPDNVVYIKELAPEVTPRSEAIEEMKADVLKQLEYHSAEQLKYKTIYEYLNQKS